MSGQEFVTNLNLKGLQIINARIENVNSATAPESLGRGHIVTLSDGSLNYHNGTNWVKLADDAVLQDVKTTVGDDNSGLVKDVADLKDAIGTDESGNNLTARVKALETAVGKEGSETVTATGLYKLVADNAADIVTNASNITDLKGRVTTAEGKVTTNASNIATLQKNLKTAQDDIDKLEASVGASDDTAKADGSVYARIAQNVADIGTLNTTVSGHTTDIAGLRSGKVDKVDGKGLSTNDYTAAEKTKLAGIAESAQVNVLEKVLFKGNGDASASALTITDKGVTIDVSDYAKKSDITTLFKFKGTVASATDLAGIANPTEGDVYNVTAAFQDGSKVYPAGTNVVYVNEKVGDSYQSKWDALGGQVDLSSYATKSYVDTEVGKKQDTLTDAQKNAVDSGITTAKVTTYDGYASSISTAQSTANTAKATADKAVVANTAITGATKCKVTYDSKGLVTGGADLAASDIPNLSADKITTGKFAEGLIPVALVTKSVTLAANTEAEVASGLTNVYLAQVLDSAGAVVLCRTVIAGGTVKLTADIGATVTVNMVGLR